MSSIVNHLWHPFSYQVEQKSQELGKNEKITAVALALIAGVAAVLLTGMPWLFGVSLPVFYLATAYLKSMPYIPARRYPPFGPYDTFRYEVFSTAHGKTLNFRDEEISLVHPFVKERHLTSYTPDGKAVILQQATRGCTAAAAAMLIADAGGQVDWAVVKTRNLGTDDDVINDLKKAGLKAIVHEAKDLDYLKELIRKNGSAIVPVSEGHVLVVDKIDGEGVELRDSYHGWKITVQRKAFEARLCPGKLIQTRTMKKQ